MKIYKLMILIRAILNKDQRKFLNKIKGYFKSSMLKTYRLINYILKIKKYKKMNTIIK